MEDNETVMRMTEKDSHRTDDLLVVRSTRDLMQILGEYDNVKGR